MDIYNFDNFRVILKSELSERIDRNPKYSLRSMAKSLGVANSTLSEVINGHANLSPVKARKVALALGLKKKDVEYFCDLARANIEKDPELKNSLLSRISKLYPRSKKSSDLSIDHFKQMSEWYHAAILELPNLTNFKLTPSNAAKLINISKVKAELAIKRLMELGYLDINSKGELARKHSQLRVESGIKNSAMRKYYRQMLDKISTSLDKQAPKERLSGYLNIPIDPKALPEIDEAIDHFFREIKLIANKYKNKTTVYHLSCHFINLTKEEK